MQEPSIFTKIINRELPAHIVYEDDRVIAFLTIRPLCDGHTLVVPKAQVDQIWDMDQADYDYLWETAKKIALHLREVFDCVRVGVVIKGFDVPHTHIHLIPVNSNEHVDFDPYPAPALADEATLEAVAKKIRM
jgi:histidine triad (HIT) family protein